MLEAIKKHIDEFGLSVREIIEHAILHGRDCSNYLRKLAEAKHIEWHKKAWGDVSYFTSTNFTRQTHDAIRIRLATNWCVNMRRDRDRTLLTPEEVASLFGEGTFSQNVNLVLSKEKNDFIVYRLYVTKTKSVEETFEHARAIALKMKENSTLKDHIESGELGLCILAPRLELASEIQQACNTQVNGAAALSSWIHVRCERAPSPETIRTAIDDWRRQP